MPLFGKKPAAKVPALSADEMKARLLGLNRPSAPFRIVDGQPEGRGPGRRMEDRGCQLV